MRGVDVREMGEEVGGFEDNTAFSVDHVREIDVDKHDARLAAGLGWIATPALPGNYIRPTAKVDDEFGLGGWPSQEVSECHINDMQSEVVATIDQRSASLKLLDKETEKVTLIRVVEALYASLGHDTRVIG